MSGIKNENAFIEKRCSECNSTILVDNEEEWKANDEICFKCRGRAKTKKKPEEKKMPKDVLRIAYDVLMKSRDHHNTTIAYFLKTFKEVYGISFYDMIVEIDERHFDDSSEFLYFGFHERDGDLSFKRLDELVTLCLQGK